MTTGSIIFGDNAEVLPTLADGSFQLIYIDPPFNTGREQVRARSSMTRTTDKTAESAVTVSGFKGASYERIRHSLMRYDDRFDDYWGFLEPKLEQAWRLLADNGTLYVHLDYREAHYAKVMLDALFGPRESCAESFRLRRTRATPCSTSSPAVARLVRLPQHSVATSCW